MAKLVALDFDGVISDSAPEAFVVALRTWVELEPGSPFRARASHFSSERAPSPADVTSDDLYRRFLELMPLGNRAEDYGVILAALESGREIEDQDGYDSFRDSLERDRLRVYHKRFYRVRAALSDADSEGWHALMKPYSELVALLRRCAGRAVLAVATAKDRCSVSKLLRRYGIDDLLPPDRVFDKETGVTKAAHLEHLRGAFGFDYVEMAFIDDKVNHLDAVAPLGVRCALAAWGYNGPREIAIARERGYIVCTLENAEESLFGSEETREAPG